MNPPVPRCPDLAFPERVEAGRVILRRYQVGDASWYLDMAQRNHAHLARFESGNSAFGLRTEADAFRVLASFDDVWARREAFFLGVFVRDTQAFAAQLYIGVSDRDLPAFRIGYFADVRHEGRGYVTEALRAAVRVLFDEVGAHRLSLGCSDQNPRSQAVAERCGFVREGHLRADRRLPDGSLGGSLLYGMLRADFEDAARVWDGRGMATRPGGVKA